jgi:ABC-type polysaccharide/polyol phosphate export permease
VGRRPGLEPLLPIIKNVRMALTNNISLEIPWPGAGTPVYSFVFRFCFLFSGVFFLTKFWK